MGIPAFKLKLTVAFCAVLLGCACGAKAADDGAAPAVKAEKADGDAKEKSADKADKKDAVASAKKKEPEENPYMWSSKTGAQLWLQDCRQCHNIRSPATLSASEWEIAMSHMRFRCNLTAKEYRKIKALLAGK
jgi:nucleoid-associated protein YgaU